MTIHVKGNNNFEHVMYRENGGQGVKLRILCSAKNSPDCQYDGEARLKTPTCVQEFAERMFRGKGWDIGKDRTKDVCPHCVKFASAKLKTQLEMSLDKVKAMMTPPVVLEVKAPEVVHAAKNKNVPAPKSRRRADGHAETPAGRVYGDRRKADEMDFVLEFIASHSMYHKGMVRYRTGWHDKRVFNELKEVYGWVKQHYVITELRRDYFGVSRVMATTEPKPNQQITANIADINDYTVQRLPHPSLGAPGFEAAVVKAMEPPVAPAATPTAPEPASGPARALLARLARIETVQQQQDVLLKAMKARIEELSDEIDGFFKELED